MTGVNKQRLAQPAPTVSFNIRGYREYLAKARQTFLQDAQSDQPLQTVQQAYSKSLRDLFASIAHDVKAVLGAPPSAFVIAVMGSAHRGDMNLDSDIESLIPVANYSDPTVQRYQQTFFELLLMVMSAIGESHEHCLGFHWDVAEPCFGHYGNGAAQGIHQHYTHAQSIFMNTPSNIIQRIFNPTEKTSPLIRNAVFGLRNHGCVCRG